MHTHIKHTQSAAKNPTAKQSNRHLFTHTYTNCIHAPIEYDHPVHHGRIAEGSGENEDVAKKR